jgi:DNA-binding MurR/RpiR family transcriptional regulator
VDMQRILDRIAAGSSNEAAIYEVLHINYDEVIQGTAAYLRKTYL